MAAAAGTSTALENYLTTQTLPRLSHMTESFGPESSSTREALSQPAAKPSGGSGLGVQPLDLSVPALRPWGYAA